MKTTRVRVAVRNLSVSALSLILFLAAMGCSSGYGGGGGGNNAPYISGLSTGSGPVGTAVTITGTHFGATQGSGTVTFNGQAATPTSWSDTSITAPVPTGATTGPVVVTVGGVSSNASTFTVTSTPGPNITSLNPTSGPVGTSVTINGTNFGASQANSTVKFNGTAATPSSWIATSIVVPVPTGATSGYVVVTVNGVASNGMSFTVTTSSSAAFPIKLSANKRYFVDANNNPWLMVADAAHHLMPVIGSTTSSIQQYINDRKTNGFNTINFYGACASGSGTCPPSGAANNGQLPFSTGTNNQTYDLSTPNPNYWSQVDNVINLANQAGMVVLFEPLPWGVDFGTAMEDTGTTGGPVNYISCGNPVGLPCNSNDYNFGIFLGNRYKNFPNIIWQFGQDFRGANLPDATFMDYQAQVIAGVASVDTNHLITAQMNYYRSYTQQAESLANSNFNSNVNVSFVYTYYETYDYTHLAYASTPTMPAFLGESNYETGNNTGLLSPSPANAFITRMEMWWPMTSGAAGFEFGNEHVNHFDSTSPSWQSQLDTAATLQVKYVAQLLGPLSWQNLVPDTNHAIVTAGFGTCNSTSAGNENLYNASCATTAADSLTSATFSITYTPVAAPNLTADMTKFSKATINASWYDPTTGASQAIGSFSNTGTQMFPTPGTAHADGTHDWVLLLQ